MSAFASNHSRASKSNAYGLRTSGAKGYGVFANTRFVAGDLVIPGVIVAIADENDSYAIQAGPSEFVYEGALKEFVNHSCEPNCGVRIDAEGALDLIARRTIGEGDEITVDYAMHSYTVEHFPSRCLCGSAICRRHVTGWKDLPDKRKVEYGDLVAPFLLQIDHKEGFEPVRAMSSAV